MDTPAIRVRSRTDGAFIHIHQNACFTKNFDHRLARSQSGIRDFAFLRLLPERMQIVINFGCTVVPKNQGRQDLVGCTGIRAMTNFSSTTRSPVR